MSTGVSRQPSVARIRVAYRPGALLFAVPHAGPLPALLAHLAFAEGKHESCRREMPRAALRPP
jgi:hypothetical protein